MSLRVYLVAIDATSSFNGPFAYIRVISAYAPYALEPGARYSMSCYVYREIPTEACLGAYMYNCALSRATRVKFQDLRERITGYRLAFKVKVYDLCEW